jgi:hypothetical protein
MYCPKSSVVPQLNVGTINNIVYVSPNPLEATL